MTEPYCSRVGVPSTDPSFAGVRTKDVSDLVELLTGFDCIFAVGCKLFTQLRYRSQSALPMGAKVIHLHPDAREIAQSPADLGLIGAIAPSLRELIRLLGEHAKGTGTLRADNRVQWIREQRAATQRSVDDATREAWDRTPISPWRLLAELRSALGDDVIVVDESGRTAGYLLAGGPSLPPASITQRRRVRSAGD